MTAYTYPSNEDTSLADQIKKKSKQLFFIKTDPKFQSLPNKAFKVVLFSK